MGAGFIGLEVAENLVHRGLDVTIVELADQVLAPLDPEMAALVQHRLRANGVGCILGSVRSPRSGRPTVTLLRRRHDAGRRWWSRAIGVRPESKLANDAGLTIGERGGIVVDDQQRTSDPAIYAVGDAVIKTDAVTPAPTPSCRWRTRPTATDASSPTSSPDATSPSPARARHRHRRACSACRPRPPAGTRSSALAEGRAIRVIHTHPADHAGYYPGGKGMALKLVVDAETDAILGAQGVGGAGVDKRIDVIATAMRGGLTASELADLELAYAPQFGSAKDPVNMLGYDRREPGATASPRRSSGTNSTLRCAAASR